MFNLFKGSSLTKKLSNYQSSAIETLFGSFIKEFALPGVPVLSVKEDFLITTDEQVIKIIEEICKHYSCNFSTIDIHEFDEIHSRQFRIIKQLSPNEPDPSGKKSENYVFTYNSGIKEKPYALINGFLFFIASLQLQIHNFIKPDNNDFYYYVDYLNIFMGFGSVYGKMGPEQMQLRDFYLTDDEIAFTQALWHMINKNPPNILEKKFSQGLFKKINEQYNYLIKSKDTILTEDFVHEQLLQHKLFKDTDQAWKERNFEEVIHLLKLTLQHEPENTDILNNWGYALLQLKKYDEAIQLFNKALLFDEFNDVAYNNRGYCYLQIGEFEKAYIDLRSAYEMDDTNAFSHRNLGVYHLMQGNFVKALEFFNKTYQIDYETELIHFYLYKACKSLGDTDTANKELNLSKQLNEHNDSILTY